MRLWVWQCCQQDLIVELQEVKRYLLDGENLIAEYHIKWANELKAKYKNEIMGETVQNILDKEVGFKFLRVLEDAGVFKRNEEGQGSF